MSVVADTIVPVFALIALGFVLGGRRGFDLATHLSHWAGGAEDVVWRRSKLGLRMSAPEIRRLGVWMAARRAGERPARRGVGRGHIAYHRDICLVRIRGDHQARVPTGQFGGREVPGGQGAPPGRGGARGQARWVVDRQHDIVGLPLPAVSSCMQELGLDLLAWSSFTPSSSPPADEAAR